MNMPHEKPSWKASVLSCWGKSNFLRSRCSKYQKKTPCYAAKDLERRKIKGKNIEGGEDSLQPARKPSTRSKVRKKGENHRSL